MSCPETLKSVRCALGCETARTSVLIHGLSVDRFLVPGKHERLPLYEL